MSAKKGIRKSVVKDMFFIKAAIARHGMGPSGIVLLKRAMETEGLNFKK